jgi:hypothetical protein
VAKISKRETMYIGWPHASGSNNEPIRQQFRSRPKMQRDWDIRLAVADICDTREIAIDKGMNHARESRRRKGNIVVPNRNTTQADTRTVLIFLMDRKL